MLIITFAIVAAIIFLSVEIPTYIRMRDGIDLEIAVIAGLMLAGSIAVLWWGR